ncbi:hypothetical protein K0B96_12305 [Horticoccus luteus]|uniref:Uncharacterized protein n=1 Tax=Horticoccus luteus TaxID=2862869 RepID=A0A8F9TRX4_9BACT|nr:hypothetical protein [Horticoccus luteus]QYM78089.1 hypothetical protein K0B96_12305 [Horticoccus luteus]
MFTQDTRAFVNQMLVYTLVMICFSGSVGLGTVWLRHQISVTANAARDIEGRIAEVRRHIDETNATIQAEKSPDVLARRNVEMRLGLVQPREENVVRVNEDPVFRLAAKRNRTLFSDTGGASVVFRLPGTP